MSELVWTQGMRVFTVGPESKDSETLVLTEIEEVVGINPGSAPRKKIKTTNVKQTKTNTYRTGLGEPSDGSIAIQLSTDEPSHHYLLEMFLERQSLHWILGMGDAPSDGGELPTLEGGKVKLPLDRSWVQWDGELGDFPLEFPEDDNTKVTSPISTASQPIPTLKKPAAVKARAPLKTGDK